MWSAKGHGVMKMFCILIVGGGFTGFYFCWTHIRRVGPVCERQIYLRKYYPTKCRMVVGEWDSYTASKGHTSENISVTKWKMFL